jgi:hypothetical protein
MNRFAILAFAAFACSVTACSHEGEPAGYVYSSPKTLTTSTSSVQNTCSTTEGVTLTEAECAARAKEAAMRAPAVAVAPGAQTVTTGKTCTTVNGVSQCMAH